MEKILKLYTYVDGLNDTPFPSSDEQIIIGSFTYTANRMGSSPTITSTVKHRLCLDDLWNDKVYAEFNGEKYFVINTPSSSKSNDDTRYEHDLELLSEREVLNHVYFIDAVQGDSDTDVYKSNSTKVLFYGDIQQFVARLNASLSYRNLGYTAVIDDGITSEDKQVSFEDKYILEALQEEFNIFEVPYYFVGKTIHFGYTDNAITTTIKYGHNDALLSISKDNANYALINRITGVGSSDNIPYYYPNETDDQSAVEASGKKWITPSQNLMPSIYRESEGAEMFYEAKNNTYPDGEGGYYQFENEYSDTNPREGKTDFEDIKPTITWITNAAGQRIDMFSEFAYDTNDNDEVDEEGNYLHPYFFAKLRKTDGTYGFNLFDHAIESQTMQITFTSGICGACTFEIAVGEETQKNLVQVSDSGALMRDDDGNVLCGREDLQQPQTPQDRQNDTQNYEVWIALRKDSTTHPQVMPNVNYNYKPSTSDTFAILGISLPQAYILKAEDELEKSLVKHMWMNNVEKFTFSAKFSRIFFEENPDVLSQLNENARLLIEYNGKQHTLYIDSYTYKMDESSPLPEIDVDLVDTLSIGQNTLQTQLDSIKQDILSSIGGGDFLKQGLKYFLRKDVSDTAKGLITFLNGLVSDRMRSKQFSSGPLGSGYTVEIDENGDSYAEFDRMLIRKTATFIELLIQELRHVGGQIILTPASMQCSKVEEYDTYYRCYFESTDGERTINQEFVTGDQARCQTFNIKEGVNENVTNTYYWRLVVGTGDNYIDLSKTDCDAESTVPQAGDDIVQLGNRNDATRQTAIVLSAHGNDAPYIKMYRGINSYDMTGKEFFTVSRTQINIIADSLKFSTGENVKDELDTAKEDAEQAKNDAEQAKSDAEAAKNRLDKWAADGVISPTEKQGLKDEIARIKGDYDEINAQYAKYGLGTPSTYNSAYNSYLSVLTTLSASTPEVITIPSYFASRQTTYYTQRTAALNAIATAAKDYVDGLGDTVTETVMGSVNGKITLAVNTKVKDAQEEIMQEVNSQLQVLEGQISSKVSTTTFKEEKVSILNTAQGYANNALTSAKQDAANKYATIATMNTMSTRIDQLSNSISLKADSSTVTSLVNDYGDLQEHVADLETRVNSAELKITPYAIVTTVSSNLQIGGRNLLMKTNQGKLGWNWNMATGGFTSEDVTENGVLCCKMTRNSVAQTGWSVIYYGNSYINRNKYQAGKKYVVSFEVKSSVSSSFALMFCNTASLYHIQADVQNVKKSFPANTWTKLIYIVTMKNPLPTQTDQVLYLNGMISGTGVWYMFRNLKMEEGTVPTAWSPAPEDNPTETDIASAMVQTANGFTFYGKTFDIKASIMTAENIAALNITTGKLTVTTGAKIGGWTVNGNALTCSQQAGAKIKVEPSGTRFLRINDTSTLMEMRADGVVGLSIYTQDTTGKCVNLLAQTGGIAMESHGNMELEARQGESIKLNGDIRVQGLALGTSIVGANYTVPYNVSFISIQYGCTITLPANPPRGRMVICAARTADTIIYQGNGKEIWRGSGISTYVRDELDNCWNIFIYDSQRWVNIRWKNV